LYFNRERYKKGIKKVESIAQSTSTITYSYTIQLIISADINYYLHHFIVLKESSGTLDPRVQETMFTANNIFIMASKSDKLTSNHFEI